MSFFRGLSRWGKGGSVKVKNFFFCIPFKPRARCADWNHTVALLRQTLRSIFHQTDKDFFVLIAGHDRPELPELDDPRVSFHPVSFPIPRDGVEGKRDQTRKTHFLGAIAKEHGGGYIMVVDSDDLVHRDIVRFVRADDNQAGYMIRAGYVLDVASGRLGKFSGNPPRQFFNHCGTSSIIYLLPEDLPDRSPDKTDLVRGDSFMESVWGHGSWEAKFLEREIYPATLPFRGSVYRLNTGDNASYNYRRDDKTIQRLLACVERHPVSLEILKKDFGLELSAMETIDGNSIVPHVRRTGRKAGGTAGINRKSRGSVTSKSLETDGAEKKSKSLYAGRFYSERRARTLYSARRVLEIVMAQSPVRSVIDIGCGTGTWLDVARSLGATEVKGLEGTWLDLAHRDSDKIDIVKQDLEQRIVENRRYDLAISLEVAEHLSERRAASFVEDLCQLSDRVLFGAAIPGQGGRGHVNEQWQTYWAAHFSRLGYVVVDVVRPKIWTDSKIRFWYKQNTLLYCKAEILNLPDVASCLPALDVVHPGLFQRKQKKYVEKMQEMKSGRKLKQGGL